MTGAKGTIIWFTKTFVPGVYVDDAPGTVARDLAGSDMLCFTSEEGEQYVPTAQVSAISPITIPPGATVWEVEAVTVRRV